VDLCLKCGWRTLRLLGSIFRLLREHKVSRIPGARTGLIDVANVLVITIMKKETFMIHAESELARDHMMKDLTDCIDFATTGERFAWSY
jgi:hypothetical protein